MKLLPLAVLALCAIAWGANIEEVIPPPGIGVNKDLGRTQYALQLLAPNFDEGQQLPESDEVNSEDQISNRIITGAIHDLLEDFRHFVVNGNDERAPLDPLIVDSYGPFEFRPATGVVARGMIYNFRMEGLQWFVGERVTVNPVRLALGITVIVPSLTFTGEYTANTRIMLVRTEAAGEFRLFAHRVEVSVDMRLGTDVFGGGTLFLRQLDFKIDIFDTRISLTGMTGSAYLNNLINSMVQSISQDLIQSQLENVSRLVSEDLFDVINDILKDYTVSDIFG